MKPSDFTIEFTGTVVQIGDGLHAFVPRSLPPSLRCQGEMLSDHDEAMLALGELRAIIPYMPSPTLLTYPFLRREAVLSSKIEGTYTELQQLYLFEAEAAREEGGNGESYDVADALEVHNYV